MSGCSSSTFLSTGPLVGLAIAGVFLLEGVVGALVWLAVVIRRGRRSRRVKIAEQSADQGIQEVGELSAYTSRGSFLEKWLGKEAVASYTPVEYEESQPAYASYVSEHGHQNYQSFPPPPQLPSQHLAPPSFPPRSSSYDHNHGDVSYYSTAIAASLAVPSQFPAPYDPPSLITPPQQQRPELAKLEIPQSLPRETHQAPSVTSQTSYLRRLSRSLLATLSNTPPPALPLLPRPPTPPPFMSNLHPPVPSSKPLSKIYSVAPSPVERPRASRGHSQRSQVRPLPIPTSQGIAV
ncbi:hypothetical protein JCM5353_007137 [Sporobolomyces roseus]